MDSRLAKAADLLAGLGADLLACLRFYTRLPIPVLPFEKAPRETAISAHARMLPLAGALIGAVAAIVLWLATKLGLHAYLAAIFAISSLVIVGGGLHEDGLADFADATGGTTPAQRLEIMKDSRIGTFGTLALILGVLLRVSSLAFIARYNLCLACWVLIATGAVSRTLGLLPLYVLPPARDEGAGFSAAGPQEPVLAFAALGAFILGLLPLLARAGFGRVTIALVLSIAVAFGVTVLARRLFGGQTGDVAGATQQAAEITAYLVFATHL
jgi:adenosylcobinamide-GDP ribazoletransferase